MRLIPLGTNGFIPSYGRQTMSFLLLTRRSALLLDAGTGVSRLLEPELQKVLEPYPSLDIVLSHYHLDHVVGLSYLPAVWNRGPVRIWAPGPPFVDALPQEALQSLIRPPLFALTLEEYPTPVEILPVQSREMEWDGTRLYFRAQRHPGGSVGVRIADHLAYLTDTEVDTEDREFVSGLPLVLHEVWLNDQEAQRGESLRGHSAAGQVADWVARSGVKTLIPVHHHPGRTEEDLHRIASQLQRKGLKVWFAPEGHEYPLS